MRAVIFPGQGAQFIGMGKAQYMRDRGTARMFDHANAYLGYPLTEIMFNGPEDKLRETSVTQPAVFLYTLSLAGFLSYKPDMVAGHSVGEYAALVACGALTFEDAFPLVVARAGAMQRACDTVPSMMAAVIGLEDEKVEEVCATIEGSVATANYNCPGQLVISGRAGDVSRAMEQLTKAGAKRVTPLRVGGGFHSSVMEPAKEELERVIRNTPFHRATCPLYQNVDASPSRDPAVIREKLIAQLTAPVRWAQTIRAMANDGATVFVECGPGVLKDMVRKVDVQLACEIMSFV
jgi:[acyl-carrier-protein] S-malonyltransferase